MQVVGRLYDVSVRLQTKTIHRMRWIHFDSLTFRVGRAESVDTLRGGGHLLVPRPTQFRLCRHQTSFLGCEIRASISSAPEPTIEPFDAILGDALCVRIRYHASSLIALQQKLVLANATPAADKVKSVFFMANLRSDSGHCRMVPGD